MKKAEAVNALVDLNVRGWISLEEVEMNLKEINEDDRVKVLIAQLNFCRHVLPFKCEAKLFYKSETDSAGKRIDLTWEELKDNLRTVISALYSSSPEKIVKPHLKEKDQRDEAVATHKAQLMEKIKSGRIKLLTDQQKSEHLQKFIENPKSLIGLHIQHFRKEDDEGEARWCKGKVLSISEEIQNVKRTKFNVVYDSQSDRTFEYPIISHFNKGDVIILS